MERCGPVDALRKDPCPPRASYFCWMALHFGTQGALCSLVRSSCREVVVQLSQRYGGTQLTTRQCTPPLQETCVLHCP
jgi:hypothetical protein